MKIKEEKLGFKRVFLFIIFVFLLNTGIFIYQNREVVNFSRGVTTYAVADNVVDSFKEMNLKTKFLLFGQWFFLIFALFLSLLKDNRIRRIQNGSICVQLKKSSDANKTDLDVLYETLKVKKTMKLSQIMKHFKINKEIAMDWCKILESGELAVIDYPAFGEPSIIFKDKKPDGKIIEAPAVKKCGMNLEKEEPKKKSEKIKKK